MANTWFREYNDFVTDPKIQSLPFDVQRHWVCVKALYNTGNFQSFTDEEKALALRIDETELNRIKELFIKKQFIDRNWLILDWNEKQFKSDSSKERTAAWRARQSAFKGDGGVTSPSSHQAVTETSLDRHGDVTEESIKKGDSEQSLGKTDNLFNVTSQDRHENVTVTAQDTDTNTESDLLSVSVVNKAPFDLQIYPLKQIQQETIEAGVLSKDDLEHFKPTGEGWGNCYYSAKTSKAAWIVEKSFIKKIYEQIKKHSHPYCLTWNKELFDRYIDEVSYAIYFGTFYGTLKKNGEVAAINAAAVCFKGLAWNTPKGYEEMTASQAWRRLTNHPANS